MQLEVMKVPTSVGKSEMVVSETKRYIQPSLASGVRTASASGAT